MKLLEMVETNPDVRTLLFNLRQVYEDEEALLFTVMYCLRNTSPDSISKFTGISIDEAVELYSELMGYYALILHNTVIEEVVQEEVSNNGSNED